MDIGLFYGLFSAICFTLVGLWWSVVERRADVRTDPRARRDAGAIYLTFLLPALMGLFAQIGGLDSPVFWRVSFVVIALIGWRAWFASRSGRARSAAAARACAGSLSASTPLSP